MSTCILAIETSNNRTSLALRVGGETAFSAICGVRDNIGWLRQQVTAALAAQQLAMTDLTAVAVTHGPGGMTGVRVGVGFAQGLALAAQVPLAAVNTLSVMAWSVQQRIGRESEGRLSVALDARMGEIYVADWPLGASARELLEAADRVSVRDVESATEDLRVIAGPGWDLAAPEMLPAGVRTVSGVIPDAQDLAALAEHVDTREAREVQVHYLRHRVAEVPARLRDAL